MLAIFDIDGTLLTTSSERRFARYLWRHGWLGPRRVVAFLLFALRYLPVAPGDLFRRNKAYLTGLRVAELADLAERFVASELLAWVYEPAAQRLAAHVARGDDVLLLSGTLQPIAEALGERLGVNDVCATLCSEQRGILRARPPERHPFAAAKLVLARDYARGRALDLAAATAYCDSHRDLELLAAVGRPVAVRPDARLRRAAMARGWELL